MADTVADGTRKRRRRSATAGTDASMWLVVALLAFVLIGWAIGVICRSALTATDLRILQDIASNRTSAQIALSHALSYIGSGYVVFPLSVLCSAVFYRRGRQSWSLAAPVCTFGAVAIANVDKVLVGRPRPPLHHLEAVAGQSFPSGHASHTAAFCTALVLLVYDARAPRPLKIASVAASFMLVAGVAASRLCLGVHYPSDVVAGALLGVTWSLVVFRIITAPKPPGSTGATGAPAHHAFRVTTSHPPGGHPGGNELPARPTTAETSR